MENTKNMMKLNFEFILFVKTGTEPTPEANRNYDVTKMFIFGNCFIFRYIAVYNHNSLYEKIIWFPYVLFELVTFLY